MGRGHRRWGGGDSSCTQSQHLAHLDTAALASVSGTSSLPRIRLTFVLFYMLLRVLLAKFVAEWGGAVGFMQFKRLPFDRDRDARNIWEDAESVPTSCSTKAPQDTIPNPTTALDQQPRLWHSGTMHHSGQKNFGPSPKDFSLSLL